MLGKWRVSFPVECIVDDDLKDWKAWEDILNIWAEWLDCADWKCAKCDFFKECREDTFKRVELTLNPFLEPWQKVESHLTKQLNMKSNLNIVVPKGVYIFNGKKEKILLTESIPLVLEQDFIEKFTNIRNNWTPWEIRYQEKMSVTFNLKWEEYFVKESDLKLVN